MLEGRTERDGQRGQARISQPAARRRKERFQNSSAGKGESTGNRRKKRAGERFSDGDNRRYEKLEKFLIYSAAASRACVIMVSLRAFGHIFLL